MGDRIEVTSDISWEDDGRFAACDSDCGINVSATCTLGVLPDGEYTLQLGEQTQTVIVPVTDQCMF